MPKYLNFDDRGFNVENDSTWTNSEGERKIKQAFGLG